MKTILFTSLALTIGGSGVAQAIDLASSLRLEAIRFAAVSLTNSQGARAIVSNVIVRDNVSDLCPVEVSFFDADGAGIGEVINVQLKSGQSASVSASHPVGLVRAIVSVDEGPDTATVCALRASLEVFDTQTGTTFVSISGESPGGNGECGASTVPTLATAPKNNRSRENTASRSSLGKDNSGNRAVAPTSAVSGRPPPQKTRTPVVDLTPPRSPSSIPTTFSF